MAKKVSNSSKRLQEMMNIMSLKQSDIVAKTGITKSALSNYLHGTREPRQDQISRIADPYRINPSWLMGYDVPMFMDVHPSNDLMSLEEVNIIKNYRELDEESQRQLVLMLAFLKSKKQN